MAYGYDDRPQYISLMDMIDGGGAGRSGDRFEGGGLLSLLANELFRPRGYEDRLRQRKNDTGRAVSTVVDELMRERAAMREMERQRGLQQDRFDPRDQQGATDFRPPATVRELTGSADMPPELLPMNTFRKASDTLFDRSVAQGYQGADMPSYVAEKRLIEMAEFPGSKYTDLDKINYSSLMPPSLMSEASSNAPTASIAPVSPVIDALSPAPRGEYQQMGGDPRYVQARQKVIELMGEERFFGESPSTQEYLVNYFMEQRGY